MAGEIKSLGRKPQQIDFISKTKECIKFAKCLIPEARIEGSSPSPQLGDEENDGNYFGRFFERNFVFARKDLGKFFFGGTGNRKSHRGISTPIETLFIRRD